MSTDVYIQFLRWTVTESAASTLTEGNAILTGASMRGASGGIGIEIHDVITQLAFPADDPAASSTESVTGCVSTRSGLSAMPTLDDEHVIYLTATTNRSGVATYLPMVADFAKFMPKIIHFTKPLLITHSKLYPYVLSTNASAAAAFKGLMAYNFIDIDGPIAMEALEVFR